MRLLLVKRDASVAGDTTYLLMLAQGLVERGHEVILASGPGKLAKRFRQLGVRRWLMPPHPLGMPLLKRRAAGAGVDAVVTTGRGGLRWTAYEVANQLRVPCIATLQDHIEQGQPIDEYDHADAVVAVERPIVDRAIELGVPRDKLALWPRPVFERELGPAPTVGFPVLWMNRMSGSKAWSAKTLLEALPAIHDRAPGLRFTLVGGGSKAFGVRRQASAVNRRLGLRVAEVRPFTLDPLGAMAQASLVVGGGYTCLEAIFNGRPAIAAGFGYLGPMTADRIQEGYDRHFGDRKCPRCGPDELADAVCTAHESLTEQGALSPFMPDRSWFTLDHSLDGQARRLEELVAEIRSQRRIRAKAA